jgi:hypothetical protein
MDSDDVKDEILEIPKPDPLKIDLDIRKSGEVCFDDSSFLIRPVNCQEFRGSHLMRAI